LTTEPVQFLRGESKTKSAYEFVPDAMTEIHSDRGLSQKRNTMKFTRLLIIKYRNSVIRFNFFLSYLEPIIHKYEL